MEATEYAVANKIAEEPASARWVRKALRKQDRIIKKVKARYWAMMHKQVWHQIAKKDGGRGPQD